MKPGTGAYPYELRATEKTKFEKSNAEIVTSNKGSYKKMGLNDALQKSREKEIFSIECSAVIIDVDSSGIYKACVTPRCAKKLDSSEENGYLCSKCGYVGNEYANNIKLKVSNSHILFIYCFIFWVFRNNFSSFSICISISIF